MEQQLQLQLQFQFIQFEQFLQPGNNKQFVFKFFQSRGH